MYQRNQQQPLLPNRDNYNDNNNHESSESDSDSDPDMDENNADGDNEDMILPNIDIADCEEIEPRPIVDDILHYQLDNDNDNDDEILRIHENAENISDDPALVALDVGLRENFEFDMMGEGSRCDLNLEAVPPTANDESSRESLDMDYESDKPTLGNIVVDRASVTKERNDSDEEASFYENVEFCNYLRNGDSDEVASCKCGKCEIKDDCLLDVCYKQRDSTADTCRKLCSENDDEEFNIEKNLNNHDFSKDIDDKIDDIDIEDHDAVDKKREEEAPQCSCFEEQLDHVNGHSSKMCLELEKIPCEKCKNKNKKNSPLLGSLPLTSSNLKSSTSSKNLETEEGKAPENLELENNSNLANVGADVAIQNIINNNRGIVRHRDNNVEVENIRPNKRPKLSNSASNKNKVPRTIFHKALDAVNMTWDNQHLKNILASSTYSISSSNAVQTAGSSKPSQTVLTTVKANFNAFGQPLWHEPLAMCAARIDSLRSHGHTDAALRLSVSVVRTMKQVQKDSQMIWKRYQAVANIQYIDDIPTMSTNCCCDGGKSTSKHSNGKSSDESSNGQKVGCSNGKFVSDSKLTGNQSCTACNQSNNNDGNNSISRKRSYDSSKNNGNHLGYSPSSAMTNRGYKMYRFDYGNYPSVYRYSMNGDDCKRCVDARERVRYPDNFNGGYYSGRFGMNGKYPPYFRNSFAPVHGNMFDQRFNVNHSGTNGYRYSNNYPSNILNHRQCHSENCNVVHRVQQNHYLQNNEPHYGNGMFGISRGNCNRDPNNPHMNNYHGNYNPNNNPVDRRCSHDLRLRGMIDAPMRPRPITNDAVKKNQTNNREGCIDRKSEEPSTSSMVNMTSNGSGSSTSVSNVSVPSNDNQMEASSSKSGIDSITQNKIMQCCSKNNCCNSVVEKSKLCQNEMNYSICHCQQLPSNACAFSSNNNLNSNCLSNNIYFGRNISFDAHDINNHNRCQNQKRDESSCCCCRSNPQQSNKNLNKESRTSTSTVNYGASTSKTNLNKSPQIPIEFTRNKKSNCASNCIDCTVGCDIEFPLDAVACIFDCLTEACIIPDAMNGPDMGRLSFDSVTSAAEDGSLVPPRYQHVPVPSSNDRNETYLTLAFETAVLALGKQRNVPQGGYLQQVICKQQDQLIQRLRHVELDRLLIEVLKQLTSQLLDSGPTSGLGMSIHTESFPMHTLARFLFASLLTHYDDLAFFVGLRAMRLPNREEYMNEISMEIPGPHNSHRDGFMIPRYNRFVF